MTAIASDDTVYMGKDLVSMTYTKDGADVTWDIGNAEDFVKAAAGGDTPQAARAEIRGDRAVRIDPRNACRRRKRFHWSSAAAEKNGCFYRDGLRTEHVKKRKRL